MASKKETKKPAAPKPAPEKPEEPSEEDEKEQLVGNLPWEDKPCRCVENCKSAWQK
jgi:hypothetical protein